MFLTSQSFIQKSSNVNHNFHYDLFNFLFLPFPSVKFRCPPRAFQIPLQFSTPAIPSLSLFNSPLLVILILFLDFFYSWKWLPICANRQAANSNGAASCIKYARVIWMEVYELRDEMGTNRIKRKEDRNYQKDGMKWQHSNAS